MQKYKMCQLVGAAMGFPWQIQPMTLTNWTWKLTFFQPDSMTAEWNDKVLFRAGCEEAAEYIPPWGDQLMWDGFSWLSAVSVEVQTIVSFVWKGETGWPSRLDSSNPLC